MKFLAKSKANNKKQPKYNIKPNDCCVGSVAKITIPSIEHNNNKTHLIIISIISQYLSLIVDYKLLDLLTH